ncbi:ATP-binding cassette domain-containing protein [Hoyosella rhizosphaerae]|uniref:ABC transporter domain-containing protein n=1 Tax=Hoyosella rhizosphaerae TaxID=1755582 RepID=A0A916U7W6_9ACTN|nr:ATP-binding cassette domain-containing protein [Hoyosella rhizosphaerae]MBN4927693.1 ATP-binding cassette domain-containing protein [Hoyosella rhizosphaerae]GGC62422.1 hypothetical protein GCM10011410_13570 [Hoyosella rhizosphaerae]
MGSDTTDAAPEDREPAISADSLALKGTRGPVYGPHTFTIPEGGITVLQSPPGTGRTALLLTLTGRMRPTSGSLTILGLPYPKRGHRIRKHTSIAGFSTIDDLDDALTVGDAIRERDTWATPAYRFVGRTTNDRVDEVCALMFDDRPIPTAKTVVWDLSQLDRLLLQVSLALVDDPHILAVDDLAQVENLTDRAHLIDRLAALTPHRTVLTTAVEHVTQDPTVSHLGLATSR